MALTFQEASSSNFSSKSKSTRKWNFHVFLSFRGEDTRKGFTDHLYAALCRKGLKAFRDDEELEKGEVISQKLLQAIEGSLFAVVVVSKNYASSSWCLNELQHILTSRNELGQEIFPIFYGVDPSDVRHQKGSFAEAFTKHEEKFTEDQEKVQKWRDSLTNLATLSGWDSNNWHESQLIENVVQVLWSKLHSKLPSYNGTLVGINSRLDEIDLVLGIGLDDVRFVGLWGMGGIGKTTLASVLYERIQNQFEICCFLSNVREISERYDNSQIHLQTQLLSHLQVKGMVIENTYQGKNIILNLFCNKKVLLVLDDVSLIIQLENLAESKEWFGAGSRVVITTRNVQLLKSHGVDEIYEVKILNKEESLRLFANKAFRRDQPKEGYLGLSESMVNSAGGLPLALGVLGSFLFGRSALEWKDALDKLKQVPNNDVIKILKISYEGLDDEEKMIFLDIACFFNGWDKNEVIQILMDCGLHARVGIKVLVEKSLLNDGMHLGMHDLIQEMGKSIVFQQCPSNAGKRSRLWSIEDVYQVLKGNMGTDVIQGIVLHIGKSYKIDWDLEAFSSMCNLGLLIISNNLHLSRALKCLPSALKVLQWREYPLKTLPPETQLDKLIHLKLRDSKIKQLWNERQCLKNLRFLDVSHSKYLIKIPNFSELPNLETLELEGCVDLVELHPSLGQHKKLQVLNLKGCKNMKALPRKLEMNSLKEFVLCGCIQLRNLPEFGENMTNLITLDVEETSIVKLPESLGLLTSLETLNLRGCKHLVYLPHNIHSLKYLKVLDISNCSKFSRLPENLNENEALEKLDASGTAITEVPSSIGHLEKLKRLSFQGCKSPTLNSWILPLPLNIFQRHSIPKGVILPNSIFNLKSLTELDLSYCNIDDGFIPDDLGGLSSLWKLDLSGNMFVNLPIGCISNLLKLRLVNLNSCPRLESLPQPSPDLYRMDGGECASLENLTEEQLSRLFHLIDQGGQYGEQIGGLKLFSVTIPGCEIPLWFENQNYLCLNENDASIIIDIPPCEWLGIGLCTVLDDDMFYSTEAYENNFGSPRWWFDFVQASDGEIVPILGRLLEFETEIKSPHLWIMLIQIIGDHFYELSRNHSQIHLKFFTDWKIAKLGGKVSMKCGWRILCKGDFEKWGKSMSQSLLPILDKHKDAEYKMFSEAEEQEQCNLALSESSQTIIKECETMSPEISSSCLEEESKLDNLWMQFITDDARFWF